MRKIKLFLSLLMLIAFSVGNVWATDPVDVLTASDLAATSTTYADFSGVAGENSDAVYAGQSAKTSSGGIQLRSKNSNSGIVSTTSGGVVKSVKITVESGSNTIDIYGSNTAYSGAADLYNSNKQGTIVGSLTETGTVTFTDEYAYVGIRSKSGALYLSSVEITWTSSAPPTHTITAESNNTTYGTVSLSGSVITGSPKPGCRYASPAYTVKSGAATVSQNGNAFTVTPSSDCTIQINFEEIPSYTVTWNNNGDESVTTHVNEGEKPVFPTTPTSCDATSTTFLGWATAPWTGKIANLDNKTVYTSADAMPAVSGAVTYYAVFAKVAGESGWIETAIGNLGASDVFVFSDGSYALNNDGGTGNAPTVNAITVSAGKITSAVADKLKWNISGNATDGYTFYPNGSTTTWLYCNTTASSSSNNNMRVGTGDRKVFEIDDDGYLVTKDTYTARYLSIYNNADFRGYTSTSLAIEPKFYKYSAGTTFDYMTTCCTKYNVAIAAGIENGSVTADIASACEGTEITLTPSAAGGYHFDAWDVYKTGESATKVTVTANKFNMPAYDVTVSASFEHDPCENLDAPTLNEIVKTYNSANIAWNTVTDAVAYAVSVVKDGESEPVFSGNVTELSKALENLEPETQYNYTIMAVGDGSVKCADGNGVLEGNFTTEALPEAVLTLMENGNSVEGGSHAITVPFALPTAVTYTCGKTFVGWTSKSDFADGDEELPSYYEKGAEFTFENTTPVTLYAVYADGGATEEKASVTIADYAAANSWGNGTQYNFVTLDENITATASSGTNTGKYYTTGNEWRFYQGESATITIATTVGELSSIKFTYNVDKTGILEDAENNVVETATAVAASGTSAVYHVANSGTATNGQVRFTAIEVKYLKPGTLSNYSITCAAAPEAIVDPEVINATAEGGNGIIEAAYDNVDEEHISVDLFNDAACTVAFEDSWLTASINGDKNIAYTVAASDVYVARTAYIKLTAPETTGATAPAVVIIPVSQEGKATVFSSLEDLVAAELASGTEVTVSFSNILITEVYTTNAGYRYGLYLNVKDKDGENDIELFYNKQGETEQVPDTWVKNGYVSATNLVTTWTEYKGQWELAMQGATWSWENGGITYGAPKAVKSVVVSGEPAKKTYVDGEKFNPAGLTVTVNYTIGEPDVIDAADAEWVYETSDVMALNQTSINVKATYNTVTSKNFYEVTDLTVNPIPNKTIAQFIADEGGRCYLEGIVSGNINTTYGNFDLQDETGTIYVYGSDVFDDHGVAQGDKVKVIAEEYLLYKKQGNPDKDEALNVVFVSKVSAATIEIDDIDMTEGDELLLSDIVATITPDAAQSATINYEVTEGTAVTISEGKIIANTEGEATITASIAAGEGYLAGSTTFTVNVSPAPVPFEGDYFVKVDDNSDLTAGEYLIVYEAGNVAFNGGLETLDAVSNTVAVTFENGKIQGTDDVLAATFTIKLAGTIQSKSGYYIGRTGNSNGMNTSEDEAYTNAISIDGSGNAVILASGGAYLRYNSADNQKRFRYFQSSSYTAQKAIQLYKKENAEPVYETVRTELEPNAYYTMCLDKAVTAVRGGSIWRVLSKAQNSSDIILEEVELPLEAGRPYIFYATADKLEVVYNGAAVSTPIEEDNNGLVGSFQKASITANASNYIIYNNELYYVNSGNVYVGEHRAYLNMGGVPDYSEPQQQQGAPRRRVTMAVHSEQVATGMENVQGDNVQCTKVLINGQLFIIRGEKMFDAKGQLVK